MGNLLRRLLRWLSGRPDKVMYIGGSDTLPPPLPRQEEAEWISRLEQGELLARQTLIERNLRLVVYIARRFENTGINIEDLISIGTIGLIKAINTFRADKNIKLATYASRCIENEILMYLRKNAGQRTEVSFDEPLNTDWDGKELLLSDVLGTEGDVVMRPIEADVDRKLLSDAVARLSPREKDIISLRFGLGGRKELTQKEVADRMKEGPGSKDYGALSLAVQYYARPEIVANVPPNCFIPRPNVGSAVIRLTRHTDPPVTVRDEKLMFKLIRASFNQRRKTLQNGLNNAPELPFSKEKVAAAIARMGLPASVRGEALTLSQFAELSDILGES